MSILFIPDEQAMLASGAALAKVCSAPAIIFLYGNLGAGKTTFSRGFLRGFGFQGNVKSPTYTIVEPYELNNIIIFHFDFYRIHDMHELEFIGIQDYFTPNSICLVEWPEQGGTLLPPADLSCYIETKDLGREMKIIPHSEQGHAIFKRWQHENK